MQEVSTAEIMTEQEYQNSGARRQPVTHVEKQIHMRGVTMRGARKIIQDFYGQLVRSDGHMAILVPEQCVIDYYDGPCVKKWGFFMGQTSVQLSNPRRVRGYYGVVLCDFT